MEQHKSQNVENFVNGHLTILVGTWGIDEILCTDKENDVQYSAQFYRDVQCTEQQILAKIQFLLDLAKTDAYKSASVNTQKDAQRLYKNSLEHKKQFYPSLSDKEGEIQSLREDFEKEIQSLKQDIWFKNNELDKAEVRLNKLNSKLNRISSIIDNNND